MGKVADFFFYKKLWNPHVVYVGDTVEWKDFLHGDTHESIVTKIEHKPLQGHSFSEEMQCLPLWEKEEYVVHLSTASILAGDILVRKVIRKAADRKFIQASGSHKYAT